LERNKGSDPVLKKVAVGSRTPPKLVEVVREIGKRLEKRLRGRPYLGR